MIASITVLVPVRGQATFLADAIASLRAQTCTDWQALLLTCDDATLHAANTHIDGDVRMQVMQAGGDEIAALAHAANTLQTEFLCVLDGDDLLEPDALTALRDALLVVPDAGMAYGRHTLIDAAGKPLGPGPLCELPYSADALLLDFMTGPLRLFRTAAYRDCGGYDPATADAADYDLCLRLAETCAIGHLPQPLYRYRIRRSSISHASRLRQVRSSFEAAQRALQRRGMARDHALSLGLRARHVLRPKAGVVSAGDPEAEQCMRRSPPFDPASAAQVHDWQAQIEQRYRAFVADAQQRGLDARYDCMLEIDSWHVLQPLRPFGGVGNWR